MISQDSSYDFKAIATYPQVTNFQNRPMKNNIKTMGGGGRGVKVFGNTETATKNNLE